MEQKFGYLEMSFGSSSEHRDLASQSVMLPALLPLSPSADITYVVYVLFRLKPAIMRCTSKLTYGPFIKNFVRTSTN
jgi:hypothetical protein